MKVSELTSAVLRIQAHSKMMLAYRQDGNMAFAIASFKAMEEEVKIIRNGCLCHDDTGFYLAK